MLHLLAQIPFPPPVSHASPWELAQAWAVVFVALGGATGLVILTRAFAQRLAGGQREPEVASAEVAELRDSVQHLTGRVGELEERIDFAERLLARERDAERLKGPKA